MTPPQIAALRGFVAAGGLVIIATGRGRAFAAEVARDLERQSIVISDIVASDGGVVVARNEGLWDRVTSCNLMEGSEVAALLERILSEVPDADFAAEIDDRGVIISSETYLERVRYQD